MADSKVDVEFKIKPAIPPEMNFKSASNDKLAVEISFLKDKFDFILQ